MSVQAQRERHLRLERERAVVRMRASVVTAVRPQFILQVGSSAVLEAVDEALAQIVAAGGHLGEPDEVRAIWITCARRRLIDEQRLTERKRRRVGARDAVPSEADDVDLSQLIEDARQRWRIHEILSVLRGDQRRWAEAWYDEVLSSSRARGGQPRGLAEALGWSAAKTKSVSRRARLKMAAFIDARASGAVCEEQQEQLDALILAGRAGYELEDARFQSVVFHLAGCEDCQAVWRTRRRTLSARAGAVLLVPVDVVAAAAQSLGAKLGGLATGVHARIGVGGAAATGGGAATIGGKATAVCVGVVCAAAAGGEIVGVLPPISKEPHRRSRGAVRPARTHAPVVKTIRRVDTKVAQAPLAQVQAKAKAKAKAPPAPPAVPAVQEQVKSVVRKALAEPRKAVVRAVPGDLPPAGSAAATAPSQRSAAAPPAAFGSPSQSSCVPGSLGC